MPQGVRLINFCDARLSNATHQGCTRMLQTCALACKITNSRKHSYASMRTSLAVFLPHTSQLASCSTDSWCNKTRLAQTRDREGQTRKQSAGCRDHAPTPSYDIPTQTNVRSGTNRSASWTRGAWVQGPGIRMRCTHADKKGIM